MKTKRIVLIGFVCSYKTTVGKKLAKLLSIAHCDTDTMVENISDLTVAEIIETNGEEYFRNLERIAVTKLPTANCVVSCGGGIVVNQECMDALCHNSFVVWLSTSPEIIYHRLKHSNHERPLQDGKDYSDLVAMVELRNKLYQHYSNITVATDEKTSACIAQELAEIINTATDKVQR